MITKIKEVYYCEHCKKRYLAKWAILKHEKSCTANPNRECNLCNQSEGYLKDLIEKYKNTFEIGTKRWDDCEYEDVKWLKDFTLKDIREDVGYCPICTLSVLRCTGMTRHPMRDAERLKLDDNFDYKKELDEWWSEHNDSSWEGE